MFNFFQTFPGVHVRSLFANLNHMQSSPLLRVRIKVQLYYAHLYVIVIT